MLTEGAKNKPDSRWRFYYSQKSANVMNSLLLLIYLLLSLYFFPPFFFRIIHCITERLKCKLKI